MRTNKHDGSHRVRVSIVTDPDWSHVAAEMAYALRAHHALDELAGSGELDGLGEFTLEGHRIGVDVDVVNVNFEGQPRAGVAFDLDVTVFAESDVEFWERVTRALGTIEQAPWCVMSVDVQRIVAASATV